MTRNVVRWTLAGALALGGSGIVGGTTAAPAFAKPAALVSPFAGSYAGVFQGESTRQFWDVSIDVGSTGQIAGTATYTGYSEYSPYPIYTATGSARGSIGNDGTFELRLSAGTKRATYYGTASLDAYGNLVLSHGLSTVLARQ